MRDVSDTRVVHTSTGLKGGVVMQDEDRYFPGRSTYEITIKPRRKNTLPAGDSMLPGRYYSATRGSTRRIRRAIRQRCKFAHFRRDWIEIFSAQQYRVACTMYFTQVEDTYQAM